MDENKHESCGLTETHNGASVEQLREERFFIFFSAEEALRSFPRGTDILAQELAMSCGIAPACDPRRPTCAAAGRKFEGGTSERFLSRCADASSSAGGGRVAGLHSTASCGLVSCERAAVRRRVIVHGASITAMHD